MKKYKILITNEDHPHFGETAIAGKNDWENVFDTKMMKVEDEGEYFLCKEYFVEKCDFKVIE